MRGSRWTDLCLGAVPGPNHGDFPHTLFSLALFRRIQSASTGPSCQRPLRPFAAARKRLEHTAYTIRTVKREPPPSGQPKESALASATGQGDQRCWAFRAEILGSISTTRCHPSASCWPRSNPPSYRHPASGFGSSNRRGPSRIDVMPVRDGEGNHCTQHPDLGVTPGPWLAEWRFFCRANGPSVTCCATTQTGDGEMGFGFLDSARRSSNSGVGVSFVLSDPLHR